MGRPALDAGSVHPRLGIASTVVPLPVLLTTDVPPLLAVVVVVTLFVLTIALERRAPRMVLTALAALLAAFALLIQHVR
jgi:hypothetical protein